LEEAPMTIRTLLDFLHTMDPDRNIFVHLFKADNTGEDFEILGVGDKNGDVQIDIFEKGFAGYRGC
jgi:hypothetical protein